MRFFGSVLAALLTVSTSSAANTEQLRGSPDPFSPEAFRRQQRRKLQGIIAKKSGWYNSVDHGKCSGEICAVFGDPHVITCDGLAYDCMAVGLFTLMENHMFTIQGLFSPVKEEHRLRGVTDDLPTFGSYLGDAVVRFKSGANDTHTPVLQIGFGDVSKKYPEFTSQAGCRVRKYWGPMRNGRICDENAPRNADPLTDCSLRGWRAKTQDVFKCREKCEATEGCTKFNFRYNTYGYNSFCDLFSDEDAPLEDLPSGWSMTLAGSLDDECGVRQPMPESIDEQERRFHGAIGRKGENYCPLLLHLDGELQDISHWQGTQSNTYLVGNKDSDFNVLMNHEKLTVQYTTAGGDIANIKFHMGGAGPGERWNCHWFMETCLPRSDKAEFNAWDSGAGLMGSPDGNSQNDWMTPSGELLPIIHDHRAEYDYCDQNWCVDRPDSLFVMSGNRTWDDVRCSHNPFEDIDVEEPGACVISGDRVIAACAEVPEGLRYACELDCCVGGCEEIVGDITDGIITHEPNATDDIVYDVPDHDQCHEDTGLKHTGSNVCPSSGSVVSVLQTAGDDGSGSNALPGADEILYGLVLDIESETLAGRNLRFRVNNPFGSVANVYVQHERNYGDAGKIKEPSCDPMLETPQGCDTEAPPIEVACREFHNGDFYALVHVYFASASFPTTEGVAVDKCCYPDDDDPENDGVIAYTFSIQCACPDGTATA